MERRELLGALASGIVAVSGCVDSSAGPQSGGGENGPPDTGTDSNGETNTDTQTPPDRGPATDTPVETVRPGDETGTPAVTDDPQGEPGTPTPLDGSETDDGTPPGTDRETPVPVDGEFVHEAFVVPELVAADSPDSMGVFGDRDEQYVVAILGASRDTAPAVDAIELEAGGETFDAEAEVGNRSWKLFGYDRSYSADDPKGWVVFRLPNPFEGDPARLVWPDGAYELGDDARTRLARPPTSFSVESFETPDTVSQGGTATVSVTVKNTGDADGTFVAALNRSGPLVAFAPETAVRLSPAAGETATWTYEHSVVDREFDEDRPMTFHFNWRDDSLSRETTVESSATATPESVE